MTDHMTEAASIAVCDRYELFHQLTTHAEASWLTPDDIADACGTTRDYIVNTLNGSRDVTLEELHMLAVAYGIRIRMTVEKL